MAVLGEAGVQTRVIARYAPAAIRDRILPRVVSGDCMLAICMTEPHAGTDVANYRTNARIVGDRVILKGTKTLISRAPEAGMFVVFTRVDGKPGREGIGCVLLEPDTKGFEVTGTYHTMGGENLHEIQFNDCELPLENLVIQRRRLPQPAVRLQHAALPEPVDLARPGGRRVRRGGELCPRAHRVRQADRRPPGHPLEARRHVQGHRGRARACCIAPA